VKAIRRTGRRVSWHMREIFMFSFPEELTTLSFLLVVWFALGALNIVFRMAVPFAPMLLSWIAILFATNILLFSTGRLTTSHGLARKIFIIVAIINIIEATLGFVVLIEVALIYSQDWIYNYAFFQAAMQ